MLLDVDTAAEVCDCLGIPNANTRYRWKQQLAEQGAPVARTLNARAGLDTVPSPPTAMTVINPSSGAVRVLLRLPLRVRQTRSQSRRATPLRATPIQSGQYRSRRLSG